MEKLLRIVVFGNTANFVFTKAAVDLLRKHLKGVLPEIDVLYNYGPGNSHDYTHYIHKDVYKVSGRLNNKRLSECINFCQEMEEKLQANVEETGIQHCKPTIEQIVQDLKANLSEDDQHKLASLVASNIGYILVDETVFDPTIPTNDSPVPLDKALVEPVPEINSGGACNYYRVVVTHPMSKDQLLYVAECGDIMESLEMTYAEANMFKEIWRSAAERTLGLRKAGNTNKRAAEKMVFFANRYYQQNVNQANITDCRMVKK